MSETAVRRGSATGLSLLVRIEQWRGALPLEAVDEVVRAVAITPLRGARGPLLGYVDVRGDVRPVVDARRVFHLPRRAQRPSDRMVILSVGSDRLVIPVDEASRVGTVRVADDVPTEAVAPDPSRTAAGLRAARLDEPGGDIVALVDPVMVFGRFASGRSTATTTEAGSAPGP
jgi:purine-binding chemotaxis protein CheW